MTTTTFQSKTLTSHHRYLLGTIALNLCSENSILCNMTTRWSRTSKLRFSLHCTSQSLNKIKSELVLELQPDEWLPNSSQIVAEYGHLVSPYRRRHDSNPYYHSKLKCMVMGHLFFMEISDRACLLNKNENCQNLRRLAIDQNSFQYFEKPFLLLTSQFVFKCQLDRTWKNWEKWSCHGFWLR